ncbi:MAG: hypothetical protein ACK5FV_11685, partial [Bacteroidota bacterium]
QFTGLVAGTYTVYVKDDAGNEESSMVTITDPPPVTANVTGDLTVCSGSCWTNRTWCGRCKCWCCQRVEYNLCPGRFLGRRL